MSDKMTPERKKEIENIACKYGEENSLACELLEEVEALEAALATTERRREQAEGQSRADGIAGQATMEEAYNRIVVLEAERDALREVVTTLHGALAESLSQINSGVTVYAPEPRHNGSMRVEQYHRLCETMLRIDVDALAASPQSDGVRVSLEEIILEADTRMRDAWESLRDDDGPDVAMGFLHWCSDSHVIVQGLRAKDAALQAQEGVRE